MTKSFGHLLQSLEPPCLLFAARFAVLADRLEAPPSAGVRVPTSSTSAPAPKIFFSTYKG